MDRKAKEKENRGYFMRKAKQKARPIVEKRRKQLAREGKELSREEENKIIEKVAKKIKREVAVRGFFAAMGLSAGIGVGATGMKLLNEAQNKGITQTESTINIDAVEAGKDVNIKNEDENNKYNERKIFVNSIQVGDKEIKENISEEVENLTTKQDVLNYVKNMIIQENNYTQLKESDITINKNQSDIKIYEDKAKNGDDILRYTYDSSENYEKGLYTIEINTAEGLQKQRIARNEDDNSVRIYDSDEEVEEYSENEASELGDVIMKGTDYAIAIENEENDSDTKNTYKNRFVNAIAKYKNKKIERIINGEEYNKTNTNTIQEIE